METKFGGWGWLLIAGFLLASSAVRSQDAPPEAFQFPVPVGSTRYDEGGIYGALEYTMFYMTRPIRSQTIGHQGFIDTDGSITGSRGTKVSNGFALSADDLGHATAIPGYSITVGWKFRDGLAVELSYWHLFDAKYTGGVTLFSRGNFFEGPNDLHDTFFFAPVFNFGPEWAGPDTKLGVGNPGATFGIWNAASAMFLVYRQRFQQWDLNARIPIFQNEGIRTYGLFGPRLVWFWERFRWDTISTDINGEFTLADWAIYSNVISQRMYGVHIGCGTDWHLADTPIGAFGTSLDFQFSPLVNIAKINEKYDRADHLAVSKRSWQSFNFVPEVQAQVNLYYYPPITGVEMRLGYSLMAFFNTISSPNPVSFDLNQLDAQWQAGQLRFLTGLNVGIMFSF